MKTLTIELVKGYLGTDLQIGRMTYDDIYKRVEYKLNGKNIDDVIQYKNLKPILYPLSTLTKFREDLGFVPIVEISGLRCLKGDISFGYENKMFWVKIRLPKSNEFVCKTFPSDANSMEYWIIQKLYEWHFDIHGLIEQGLAIDKSKLK